MKLLFQFVLFISVFHLPTGSPGQNQSFFEYDDSIISYVYDPAKKNIGMYWKDDQGNIFGSIQNLKTKVEGNGDKLLFAMNGGIYDPGSIPKGLFVQSGVELKPLDTGIGPPNFHWKPNGVFYVTSKGKAVVCKTEDYKSSQIIEFATQSGPMLVINGNIHPEFNPESKFMFTRNGVGILPNGKAVFAITTVGMNLYTFAKYFKDLGCKNALYFDGNIIGAYIPEKNFFQEGKDLAVIIAVTGK